MATRSMVDYASRVAYQLETFPDYRGHRNLRDSVGSLSTVRFADGELEVEVKTSVRGKDVFLFGNAGRNDQHLSVEENKMELYHAIDALKRAQAERITLFEPFCTASRSDRTTRRNSVGFCIHYKTLVSLGIDHIITYQLHSEKSKTIVDPDICSIDDVPASSLIEEYLTDKFIKSKENLTEEIQARWVFCSVDAGSESLAKKYAAAFNTPLIIAHKHRDYSKTNTVDSIDILTDSPIQGKEIWIVDDMIDTAGSVYTLVRELANRGVGKINIAAIHPVFSSPALERLTALYEEQALNSVVVLDTVPCTSSLRDQMPFLHVVSSARRSAEIVKRRNDEGSLSPFFEEFNAWDYLSSMRLFM